MKQVSTWVRASAHMKYSSEPAIAVQLSQFAAQTSEPSGQSLYWSHSQPPGIQSPSLHSHSLSGHPLARLAGRLERREQPRRSGSSDIMGGSSDIMGIFAMRLYVLSSTPGQSLNTRKCSSTARIRGCKLRPYAAAISGLANVNSRSII